jgi:hypothetical protein
MTIKIRENSSSKIFSAFVCIALSFCFVGFLHAAEAKPAAWDAALADARKEGKLVLGLPPNAELRKQIEPLFKSRFGLEVETFSAAGPDIANRIVNESRAGVRYFDALIFGSCTGLPLIHSGAFEPMDSYMTCPR